MTALEHLSAGYGLDNAATGATPDQTAVFAFVQRRLCIANDIAQLGAALDLLIGVENDELG